MENVISKMVSEFEAGKVSRRQFVQNIAAFTAVAAGTQTVARAQEKKPVFQAVNLNHIALRVTDVQRSRDFYQKMLGLKVDREGDNNCFMTFGNHFLALFKGDEPRMDHYCYSIESYSVNKAEELLKKEGLNPRVQSSRIYFNDPDGLEVQLAGVEHKP